MLIASDGHSDVLAHFGPGDQIMTIMPMRKVEESTTTYPILAFMVGRA
jgi:hypothetical protein